MKTFLLALAAFLMAPAIAAQETFTVEATQTVLAFFINDNEQPTLELVRGETYIFDVSDVDQIHPFWISQHAIGGVGGTDSWDEGVTNNGAHENSSSTEVVFEVPESEEDVPNLLYYQCGTHANMGGEIHIANPSSVEEDPSADFDLSVVSQNPGADRVTVGLALAEPSDVSVEVFDVRGRRVGMLHEGALAAGDNHRFEVGQNLRSGVYVVRATDGERMAELNVTIAR